MPGFTPEEIHPKLVAQFGDAIGPLSEPKKDRFCTFSADKLVEIAQCLKTHPAFLMDFLEDLTAVDYPKEGLIRLVYHFYSYTHRHMFVAKVELNREKPEVPTLEHLWKASNWMEREVFDLFGVNFVGHTDLRRVLLPDDWVGFPLRKDYVESGGWHGISNVRDNPLDLYLNLDREIKTAKVEPATAESKPQ